MKNKVKSKKSPLELISRSSKELGESLSRIRKNSNLTQQQVGEIAVIKQNAVSVIESGAEGVRLGTLFKLLTALNLEIVLRPRNHNEWKPEDTF